MNAYQIFEELEREVAASEFSMSAVAAKAGIQPALISRWRAKTVEPRLSTIQRLRDAFVQMQIVGK